MKFNLKPSAFSSAGKKIGDAFFPSMRMVRRKKSWVYAGQRNEFSQEFFRARHGFRVAQASSL
ncbi:MAG: hypothetical protein ABSE97_04820 [Verrucomicrobiota bacterium]